MNIENLKFSSIRSTRNTKSVRNARLTRAVRRAFRGLPGTTNTRGNFVQDRSPSTQILSRAVNNSAATTPSAKFNA